MADAATASRLTIITKKRRPIPQELFGLIHDSSNNRTSRLDGMNNAGRDSRADIDHLGIGALYRLCQLLTQRVLLRQQRIIPILPAVDECIPQHPVGDPIRNTAARIRL